MKKEIKPFDIGKMKVKTVEIIKFYFFMNILLTIASSNLMNWYQMKGPVISNFTTKGLTRGIEFETLNSAPDIIE